MSDALPPPPDAHPPPPPPPANLAPPPGYVAYGAAPTPLTRLGRIKGLAKAIVILVAIAGLTNMFAGFLQFDAADQAKQFLNGEISESEFTDATLALSALQGAAGFATLAAGILVMIWMYRVASNLRAYGVSTTWAPLWAVFGWFLPPLALYVIPFLMLRELWSKSDRAAVGQAGAAEPATGENPLLWIWFAVFGLLPAVVFAFQISSLSGTFGATDVETAAENLDSLGALGVVATLGAVIGAVVWIMFVRQLTTRHSALTGEN